MRRLVLGISLILLLSPGLSHSTDGLSDPPTWSEAPDTKEIDAGDTGFICPPLENQSWRNSQEILGVRIEKSERCSPDNPQVVAAVTKGTNNVPRRILMRTGLSEDAVRKGRDLDRDGDPDVINISLEVAELNGWTSATGRSTTWEIAPGIKPGFWVFAPETRGMATEGSAASELIRMPSPAIRVEENDRVRVTLENTHYFPHTIHFHGVDHPFQDKKGEGNDGVPQTSGEMVMPGEQHTYNFQPSEPGTFFYHCHVQPSTHVLMGLNRMLIVSKDRENNTVQTFNIGNGKVRNPSKAVDKKYDQAYDMLYQGVDRQLHNIIKMSDDPRVIAEHINRKYDITERTPDYFLLNGLSFPYTVRESQVVVEPNELTKIRVLNSGSESISIHTHGHRPVKTHVDGMKLDDPIRRDVFSVSPAQRISLKLNSTTEGLNSYGKGVWFFHNHREEAVTNNGVAPGGDITLITYESFLKENGIPKHPDTWNKYFSPKYYKGEVPVWYSDSMPEYLGEAGRRSRPASILGLFAVLGIALGGLIGWRWFR
ncbi:MAG: multicopper oxidase domain-containing protein [Candidatus Nanosalina sp.]